MPKKKAGEFVTVWIPSNRKAELLEYAARLAAPLVVGSTGTKKPDPQQIDLEEAIRANARRKARSKAGESSM
jgi:hypothetical protein